MTSHKTISTIVKEKIANMPDRFNDKEILNYIKEAIKEAKIDIKTKKVSINNIDEQKQKYSLSAYQEFMKEQQIVFKNNFPNLSSKERFKKISEEWNKVKIDKKNKEDNNVIIVEKEVNNNIVEKEKTTDNVNITDNVNKEVKVPSLLINKKNKKQL
jgi:hypothetical protein